jgi:hypothetical protein
MTAEQHEKYETLRKRCRNPDEYKGDSYMKLGTHVMFNYVVGIPNVSKEYLDQMESGIYPGSSFNIGGGLSLWTKDQILFQLGYQYLSKSWVMQYEDGRFEYNSIYFEGAREWSHMYLGGGIEYGFGQRYKYTHQGDDYYGGNKTSGIVTNNVNQQFDIFADFGGAFNIGEYIRIKPGLRLGIPFIPLFDADEYKFNIITFSVGVTTHLFFIFN